MENFYLIDNIYKKISYHYIQSNNMLNYEDLEIPNIYLRVDKVIDQQINIID